MEWVFEIADYDEISTHLAADRMVEERIKKMAEVKKYADDLRPEGIGILPFFIGNRPAACTQGLASTLFVRQIRLQNILAIKAFRPTADVIYPMPRSPKRVENFQAISKDMDPTSKQAS